MVVSAEDEEQNREIVFKPFMKVRGKKEKSKKFVGKKSGMVMSLLCRM